MIDENSNSRLEPLSLNEFGVFFEVLHGYPPFRWQTRLAQDACTGEWPDFIKLPTSSGKTAAIDVAIFALAYQAHVANRPDGVMTAARRVFFVVDRRIIVNEAYRQARATAKELWNVLASADRDESCVLYRVASWLHRLAGGGNAPPLDCFELRGGIYCDDAWVRSPLQPTILTSTVDQVGSRILFRGYGVSDRNLPIHAAMAANDSLIILDEAHCSKPFSQTLASIGRYRCDRWATLPVGSPFSFVQMTATPPDNSGNEVSFTLDSDDYKAGTLLEQRHGCKKPVELVHEPNAKGKSLARKLANTLVAKAYELARHPECKKIAIVVNRVAIARAAFELLNAKYPNDTSLMIGRMRPIDRDKLTEELQTKFASGSEAAFDAPQFVVATQCLEVGADLDFDGMVSQSASLDALRQRFGRLNRLGKAAYARGVIVVADGDLRPINRLEDDKPIDPIYGNALARTWHWLAQEANERNEVDFGIRAMDARTALIGNEKGLLGTPALDAPVLMPAHIDMLCQTSPRPTPEPNIASYLHGPDRGIPEVRVLWRADLRVRGVETRNDLEARERDWVDAVKVCPPASAECLSVPLHVFRKWLHGEIVVDLTGDVLGEHAEDEAVTAKHQQVESRRCALVWRGKRRRLTQPFFASATSEAEANAGNDGSYCVGVSNAGRLQPNDTIVIPVEFGGWNDLGFIPGAPDEPVDALEHLQDVTISGEDHASDKEVRNELAVIDVADRAFEQSRPRTVLRVHPKLNADDSVRRLFSEMLADLNSDEANLRVSYWKQRIIELIDEPNSSRQETDTDRWDGSRMRRLKELNGTIVRYPGGIAWTTSLHPDRATGMPVLPLEFYGDNHDSLSETEKVDLLQHLADVFHEACRFVDGVELAEALRATITTSAKLHDIGKADPRFQAMLLGKPVSVVFMQPKLWAKSGNRDVVRSSAVPPGFRHEMLSLDLLGRFGTSDAGDPELLAHIVASHHGHARPLAPICIDGAAPAFNLAGFGVAPVLQEERSDCTSSFQLDSGIAARFWSLNRKYGWWGLAYLESILRLADWAASAKPHQGDAASISFMNAAVNPNQSPTRKEFSSLVLTGMDGSNPLAFLAALGLFRSLATQTGEDQFRLAWAQHDGAWRPVVFSEGDLAIDQDSLVDLILERLESDPDKHPALRLAEFDGNRRDAFQQIVFDSELKDRNAAEWLSSNLSDAAAPDAISQLQTTRRDYHAINVRGILLKTTREHLSRAIFDAWDYADPIAGVSLHLEPREDRRHAYQWHAPSGDPTRRVYGGMIGANRLALEAWPLFQSLPHGDRLISVGFRGTRVSDTRLTWPIWNTPIPLRVVPTVLGHRDLQRDAIIASRLLPLGIVHAYRCKRILVGKTPNFTSAVAVL